MVTREFNPEAAAPTPHLAEDESRYCRCSPLLSRCPRFERGGWLMSADRRTTRNLSGVTYNKVQSNNYHTRLLYAVYFKLGHTTTVDVARVKTTGTSPDVLTRAQHNYAETQPYCKNSSF